MSKKNNSVEIRERDKMIKIIKEHETDDEGFKIRLKATDEVDASPTQKKGKKPKNLNLQIIKEKKNFTELSLRKQPLIPIPNLNKELSAALYSR